MARRVQTLAVHYESFKKLLISAVIVFSPTNCSSAEEDSNVSVRQFKSYDGEQS